MTKTPEGEPLIDVLARFEEEESNQFAEWAKYGMKRGWITDVYCSVHEGPPMFRWEEAEYDEHGEPPCIPAVRMLHLTADSNVAGELE